MLLRPAPNSLEVPAHMFRIEIHKWLRRGFVDPDGAEDANIHSAHEALAKHVEAVRWAGVSAGIAFDVVEVGVDRKGEVEKGRAALTDMPALDSLRVREGTFGSRMVVIVVVEE